MNNMARSIQFCIQSVPLPVIALLRALLAGDHAELTALFEAHADHVYRFALSLLRITGEAEDVVQEIFNL